MYLAIVKGHACTKIIVKLLLYSDRPKIYSADRSLHTTLFPLTAQISNTWPIPRGLASATKYDL